jgi:hypothetical protein
MMRGRSATARGARKEKPTMPQNNTGRDGQRGDPAAAFDLSERWCNVSAAQALRPFAGAFDYTSGNKHKNAGPPLP